MNNLTTRKIVLGLLMTLVLAFGVLGNLAEAQTVTRSSGDLQLKKVGDTFTISFRVSGVTFTNGVLDAGQSVTLGAPSGVTLTKINNVDAAGNTSLTGSAAPNALSNRTYTLTYTADTVGQKDIDIATVRFTIYVAADGITTDTLSLASDAADGFDFLTDEKQIDTHFSGATSRQIRYVVSGGGTVYVREANDRRGGATANLLTSSDATVYLRSNSRTNKVTVSIEGQNPDLAKSATYIYNYARITKIASGSGDMQTGLVGARLENPLIVEVKDGSNGLIPGVTVTFAPATAGQGSFLKDPEFPQDLYDADPPTTVKTDSKGRASIFLVLGGDGAQAQGATATVFSGNTGSSVTFSATAEDASAPAAISIVSGDGQRVENGLVKDPLVVKVVNRQGRRLMSTSTNTVTVEFLARDGGTLDPNTNTNPTIERITTNSSGEASINYIPPDDPGRRTVSATIVENPTKSVTFTINGPAGTRTDTGPDTGTDTGTDTTANTITISPSSISGEPGTTETITISNPAGVLVQLSSPDSGFPQSSFSPATGTAATFTSTVTLPRTIDTYTLYAAGTIGGRTISDSITVTVTEPPALGTLTITAVGSRVGNQQSIQVTAQRGGSPRSSGLTVRLSGVVLPPTVTIPAGESSTTSIVTLPSASGAHTLTAAATGYNPDSVTISAPGQQPATGQQPTPTVSVGAAASIEIDGQRRLSGTVNRAQPLRIRVVDANGNGVSNVRVTFKVLAPGQGRLSQRGNGRAVAVDTDRNGYASATLTPLGEGNLIVEAKAAKVSAPVTFIIAVGEAPDDTQTPTPTPSDDVTPSREINPMVHVKKGSHPPLLWVDGGAIYSLVDAEVQRFAPSVDTALNIAVAGGKVYWTAKTGDKGGTVNSANLDGSGVTELTSIQATPMGIAVDMAGSKLYWTNSRGRIQSANLDGSKIQNVLQNLPSPMDIVVIRGNLYWTQYDATAGAGGIGITNSAGRGSPKYISTGADMPGNLTIAGNKVYWTEMTGESGGTVNSANLNGNGEMQLASIRAVPSGIAVDTARSKLFWTNSRGRVQSANLDGSKIANVVDGLGNPGDMVLDNSIKAPIAMETDKTPAKDTPSGSASKYDINKDGTVDSTDVDLLITAVSAGVDTAKYDVNGDKKVDILDIKAVNANLDEGAAAAPTLLGTKLSAVDIGRLQEQIDLLIATGDRSPAAIKTLIYLQQLIAMARPEKTQLLANYPNPFNPETWIPYELATDTNVKITIYNTQGIVIRTLELGHQSAGYYTGRDRAAYWDGRNAFGEQVASGIYFYQFETDEMSAMRKMVILK